MTYQTMEDLAKRGGGDDTTVMDPAMRERMWATMQAKQALREALENTPAPVAAAPRTQTATTTTRVADGDVAETHRRPGGNPRVSEKPLEDRQG